jgi:hypothetical protein
MMNCAQYYGRFDLKLIAPVSTLKDKAFPNVIIKKGGLCG